MAAFPIARRDDSARRGIRRLTIDVSEDDLRTLAERGHEGAASTDHDQQAQAAGLFPQRCASANLDRLTAVARHGDVVTSLTV